MAAVVLGAVFVIAGAIVASLSALWRAQERRDGLR
jgi:hypothetical protein